MLYCMTSFDWELAIHTLVPSEEIPVGSPSTPNPFTIAPVAASSSMTWSSGPWVTHTSVPSVLMPVGCPPTLMVRTSEPSPLNSVTVPETLLATHTSDPSAVTASGAIPTGTLCTKCPPESRMVTELSVPLTTHRLEPLLVTASGEPTKLLIGVSAAALGVERVNPATERKPEKTSDAAIIVRTYRCNDDSLGELRGDLMSKYYF